MTGKHEPPNPATFYLSMATSTLRAAIILAALVFGGFVLANAFPTGGAGGPVIETTTPTDGTPTSPSPDATATTAPPPEVTVEGAVLQVLNATNVTGLAGQVANRLTEDGAIIPDDNVDNHTENLEITELLFRPGFRPLAVLLRDTYFPGATLTEAPVNDLFPDVQVTILVGQDYADAQGLGN